MKRFISLVCLAMMAFSTANAVTIHYNEDGSPDYEKINEELEKQGCPDKMYVDDEEMKTGSDAFYVHLGHNVWIQTNTVHRDKTGLYTYRACIARSMVKSHNCAYQKSWKCPYCYSYWPVGTPCQNKDCPSKYKS